MNGPGETRRDALAIVASTFAVAAVNYLLSLALVRVLAPVALAHYLALSGAVLAVGSALGTGLPAAVGAAHVRGQHSSADRFALRAALLAGVVAVPPLAVYGSFIAGSSGGLALAAAGLVVIAAPLGTCRLIGLERRRRLASGRALEASIRLVVGLVGGYLAGAAGAILGIVAGTSVFAIYGYLNRPPRDSDRRAIGIAGDAVALTALFGIAALAGSLDVLVLPLIVSSTAALGAYAATTLIARAPYFVVAGLAAAFYPALAARRNVWEVAELERAFLSFAVPGALLVAALPQQLATAVVPDAWALGPGLLAALALTGVGAATFTMGTVLTAAWGRPLRAVCLAVGGIVSAATLLTLCAQTSLVGAATADGLALLLFGLAGLLCGVDQRRALGIALRRVWLIAILASVPLVLEPWLGRVGPLWLADSLLVAWLVLRVSLRDAEPEHLPDRPLRVLHLAYEDPIAPGAGGGSVRTAEISRLLSTDGRVEWTAICRRFPGCRTRLESGVSYRHIGLPGSFFAQTPRRAAVGYFFVLPFVFHALIRRHRPDVIVEDFGAPISTFGIARLTRRPVVGVVQWFYGAEKARQYHLPFGAIERFGLASHHRLIAVSNDLASTLATRAPRAEIAIIPNGVDDAAFRVSARPAGVREGIVYLGRLEVAQKGLDLLIDAFAGIAREVRADLTIAGDGPDERLLRARAVARGLGERVHFVGRVDGPARFDLLASAAVAAVPSRYETFGIVAAEAMAVGTPVVGFDIPSLRELVVDAETGVLVPPYDVRAYASALMDLLGDEPKREAMGSSAAARSASRRWFRAAEATLEVLADAVRAPRTSVQRHGDDRAIAPALSGVRVAVIGNYGNGNAGDEAMLQRLCEMAPDRDSLAVISRDPATVSHQHHVRAVKMRFGSCVGLLLRTDRIVVGAGGMFGPNQPPLVSALPFLLVVARLFGKRISFAGTGVYPGTPGYSMLPLRLVARLADDVLVRDLTSIEMLCAGPLPAPTRIGLIPDLGFAVAAAPAPDVDDLLRAAGIDPRGDLLVIVPKASPDPKVEQAAIEVLAGLASAHARAGGQVVSLAFSATADFGLDATHADAALTRRVATGAGIKIPIVGPGLSPSITRAVVARAGRVAAMRYHAMVFALAAGRPLDALVYEPKSAALCREHATKDLRVFNLASSPNLTAQPMTARVQEGV